MIQGSYSVLAVVFLTLGFGFSDVARSMDTPPKKTPRVNVLERVRPLRQIDVPRGRQGYIDTANTYFNGDLTACFKDARRFLGRTVFQSFEWGGLYEGRTEDLESETKRLLDDSGKLRHEFRGPQAQVSYAEEFYPIKGYKGQGHMIKAFNNVWSILDAQNRLNSLWKTYLGTTEDWRRDRAALLEADGQTVKEIYKYESGLIEFATQFYNQNLQRARLNGFSVLDEFQQSQLKWPKQYRGKINDLAQDRNQILNSDGTLRSEYKGTAGYVLYSDLWNGGNMELTHINISVAIGKSTFKDLQWGQRYHGTTSQYRSERKQLFKTTNKFRSEFRRREGLLRYADLYYGGNIGRSQRNVRALLSDKEWLDLQWGRSFLGTTDQYLEIRSRIIGHNINIQSSDWRGQTRLDDFVETYLAESGLRPPFRINKMMSTRSLIKAAFTDDELLLLDWEQHPLLLESSTKKGKSSNRSKCKIILEINN